MDALEIVVPGYRPRPARKPDERSLLQLRAKCTIAEQRIDAALRRDDQRNYDTRQILTRAASKPTLCGVCGEIFSTNPACCQFGLDVACGRVH